MPRSSQMVLPLVLLAALSAVWATAEPPITESPITESPIYVTRLLHRVPRSESEVDEAHQNSRFAALQLPGGTPLDNRGEEHRVWYDVKLSKPRTQQGESNGGGPADDVRSIERSLPFVYTRRPAVCFGTQMAAGDQAELPLLTSGPILDRINTNYVALHVRVHRDAEGGEPYLHYRPEAAIGVYGKPEESVAFAALQQNALADVRGLGLFVKRNEPLSPERLRTLVIVNKGQLVIEDSTTGAIDLGKSLELMFIRARPRASARDARPASAAEGVAGGNGGSGAQGDEVDRGSNRETENNDGDDDLAVYAFATSDDRRRLHFLKPYATPEKLDECGIQSTVRITEYLLAGQYPSARAARRIHYRAVASVSLERLDRYAAASGWNGDALDNLTETLDAIIDEKVK